MRDGINCTNVALYDTEQHQWGKLPPLDGSPNATVYMIAVSNSTVYVGN
jgi:hypothetical protein